MAKSYNLTAEFHTRIKNGAYRIKVLLPDLGMFINGALVYPPDAGHDDWRFYPPSQHIGGGRYITLLEFNKQLPLWQEMSEACIDAAKNELSQSKDIVLEDIDDSPINLEDIPF